MENGKPAPDCFAAAAERLGVPAAQCLVIEDAPSGVEAATAAGMRVVLVPSIPKTEYPAPDPTAAAGDAVTKPSLALDSVLNGAISCIWQWDRSR